MPKLCEHEFFSTRTDALGRIFKTCSGCSKPLGTCPHCKELQALDAEGYIGYHDFPKPCRAVCPGAKYSSVEDVERVRPRA
jgi:hypothetical protein